MSDSFKRLFQSRLPASAAEVYQCPVDRNATVTSYRVVNTDSAPHVFRLYHGSAPTVDRIIDAVDIEGFHTLKDDTGLAIANSDKIFAAATAPDVLTLTGYGQEVG